MSPIQPTVLPSLPKYLRLRIIARRYSLSYDTVRRIFMDKPGVIAITKPNPKKRKYDLARA